MLRALRTSTRTQAGVVGGALAAVLLAGSASAALDLVPARSEAPAATAGTAALDRTVVPEAATVPVPVEPPAAPAAPAPVTPLTELRKPDLVVRSAGTLAPEQVERLRALDGVAGLALLDAGTVTLNDGPAQLLGADPSELRAFTPQETAASDPLWQAVARGDLAVAYGLSQERSLPLGGDVVVADRPGRIGAVAAFGLPAADVVVTRDKARELGAVADSVVVLSAPDLKTGALQKAVEKLVGGDVEIELLRPADVAPSAVTGKPRDYRELYIDSARYCPGLRWQILAAIGQVESAHGRHLGPSSAGALGPMQFLPSTWAAYGVDGDGDGKADIMNPFDAVPGAANYLCRSGARNGEQGLYDAIFAYNHADWYVRKVLAIAEQYR